MMMNPKNVCF